MYVYYFKYFSHFRFWAGLVWNIGILINYYSVVEQGYSTEPSNEYIVRGNDALMKCKIPSYAADMAEVTGWVDSEGHDYRMGNNYGNLINSSS